MATTVCITYLCNITVEVMEMSMFKSAEEMVEMKDENDKLRGELCTLRQELVKTTKRLA